MSDFVTLTCPSCGGKLQITPDIDRFACGHCGNEHVVKRGGGIVALAPVVAGLSKVQAGVDKTASELAIVRLEKEIPVLNGQREQLALMARRHSERLRELERSLDWRRSKREAVATAAASVAALKEDIATTDRLIATKREELDQHRQTVAIKKGTTPS